MKRGAWQATVHGILQARILEWVAISFSRRSFQLRNWTWVSCIVGRFFTNLTTREAHMFTHMYKWVPPLHSSTPQPQVSHQPCTLFTSPCICFCSSPRFSEHQRKFIINTDNDTMWDLYSTLYFTRLSLVHLREVSAIFYHLENWASRNWVMCPRWHIS